MTKVSSLYHSSDGDVLDQLVLAHYGDAGADVMSAVLEANPGLARLGPVLSAGVTINLPAYEPVEQNKTVQLWG